MPHHYFVVRATVSDPAKRAAFDTWYANEHMPDAVKTFGAEKAWRYWSLSDPAMHQATYQFPDKASLDLASEGAHRDFFHHVQGDLETRRVCGLGPIYALLRVLPGAPKGVIAHYEQTIDPQEGSIVSHAAMAFYG